MNIKALINVIEILYLSLVDHLTINSVSLLLQISEWYKGKRRLKSKMEIDPATQVYFSLQMFSINRFYSEEQNKPTICPFLKQT